MARTTSALVAGIIEVDVTIGLDPFIAAATSLVDEIASESGLGSARLELIERWLAAHFYTNRDPRPASEKIGEATVNHQSKVDLGLSTSHYGQMAMFLDTSGLLKDLDQQTRLTKRTVELTWLGTEA